MFNFISVSRKQKLNTKIITESELVVTNDASSLILRTKFFLEAHGYKVEQNILYQDNKITILLQEKEKNSPSKRTRHMNISFFPSRINSKKGNLTIKYCPNEYMTTDIMTKPLQSEKFQQSWNNILNIKWGEYRVHDIYIYEFYITWIHFKSVWTSCNRKSDFLKVTSTDP